MSLARVNDYEHLFRDQHSKAIVNKDVATKERLYRERKATQKLNDLAERVNNLEDTIGDIHTIVKALLNREENKA
jgi:hypothetical protein